MVGNGDGKFWPEKYLTRAEVLTVMARIMGVDLEPYAGIEVFDDVKHTSWYAPTVAWAKDVGLTNGVGNNLFKPHAPVTMQELAMFIARLAERRGTPLPAYDTVFNFTDHDTIWKGAREDASRLSAAGIMTGDGTGRFEPLAPIQRGLAADYFYLYIWWGILN
jgi:hypothetical protein